MHTPYNALAIERRDHHTALSGRDVEAQCEELWLRGREVIEIELGSDVGWLGQSKATAHAAF
jgi:hypothetical protein